MIMVIQLVLIVILTIGFAVIINIIEAIIKSRRLNYISFRESLDLTGLPVITFLCGDMRLNFLLDTGSTHSHISSNARNILPDEYISAADDTIEALGFTGNKEVQDSVLVSLKYKDTEYPTQVYVSEGLTEAFANIKAEEGTTLHGILGNDFLNMYDYIIDFKELIVYSKK